MAEAHIVRVFTNKDGEFGSGAGIILDENHHISDKQRQAIAIKLGFDESVFVNNIQAGDVSLYNPQQEVGFAGVPLVGTAWLLSKLQGKPITSLICQGKQIKVYEDNGMTWVTAKLSMMPPWNLEQLASPKEVEDLTLESMASKQHTVAWAWIDQGRGQIRARTFASDWDIPETEANGSGSMLLAHKAGYQKKVVVMHGQGSVIRAINGDSDLLAVGGKVIEDRSQHI